MEKKIVNYKYNTKEPNLFFCLEIGDSSFWKCALWANKVAELGLKWKIGNGKIVRFWEDHWLGLKWKIGDGKIIRF